VSGRVMGRRGCGRIGAFGGLKVRQLLRRRARAALDEGLDPPGEDAARQHDPMPAPQADETDVRAQPDYLPVGAAAGVRLPQAYNIVEGNIKRHGLLPDRTPVSYQSCPIKHGV
jgi:hypothetical protein